MSLRQPIFGRAALLLAGALALAGCEKKVTGPTPTVSRTDPQVICNAQLTTAVTVTGEGFSPAPLDSLLSGRKLAIPQLSLVRATDENGGAVSAQPLVLNPDATDTSNTRVSWASQTQMQFSTDPSMQLELGVYQVAVQNPTGGTGTLTQAFAVVPPPTVTSVEPEPVCTAQYENVVTVRGDWFLKVATQLPTVQIGALVLTATAAQECSTVAGPRSDVERCKALTVTIAQDALAPGAHDVVVTNPPPAACQSSEAVQFHIVPPPTVAAIAPTPLCDAAQANTVTVTGTGFLRIGTAIPSVKVGNLELTNVAISSASCQPVAGLTGVDTCTELTGTVPQNSLADGRHQVVVTNPQPAQCASTEVVELEVVPPPLVTDVSGNQLCTGGGTFTITGENLKGVTAVLTDSTGGTVETANVIVNEAGTSAQVSFGAGLRPETYTLTVMGATGCASTLGSKTINVTLGPVVFFMDPPATYSGISVRATIYASNVTEMPDAAVITPAGGGTETTLTNLTWASGSNIINADVPAQLPAGKYDLFVRGVGDCDAFLEDAIEVVSETNLALADPAVLPSFGLAMTDVAVTLQAKATGDLAAGEVNFLPTPRAYLSSAAGTAAPVRAIAFEDPTRLTAIVPPLAAGTYDLVVVNPPDSTGVVTVGYQAAAYRATVVAPPVIDDVTPTQLTNGTPTVINIAGQNFDPTSSMKVEAICREPAGQGTYNINTYALTGVTGSATTLQATLQSGIPHGSACAIRVTNEADATFDEWSAISVTNPASKLPEFQAGPSLNEGRRAPAMAAGRATSEARFTYVIGGDDGAAANAKATIEAASLGRFGEIGAWRVLQNQLPAARTLAVAHREGRYVFVIGGHDGTAPIKDIHRAEILDPLKAPKITDVDLRYASNQAGLAPGSWTYVVAAVYASGDADNPGGESLPSEPLTLYAPKVPGGVEVELTWTRVNGTGGAPAAQYRVYRTQAVNGTVDDLRLLKTVTGGTAATFSFTDTNPSAFEDAAKRPFRMGALGTWRKVGDLLTARAAFGFVTATTASCAPYWYAIGGMTTAATESSSYDVGSFDLATMLPGTFATHEAATAGTPTPSPTLSARRELSAWVANATTAPQLVSDPSSCQSYVYAAYGVAGTTSYQTTARYARVGPAGTLQSDEATPVDHKWLDAMAAPASVQVSGQVAFMTANGAYRMGGNTQAGIVNAATQADLCAKTGTCTPGARLATWSDATNDLRSPRYLPGMARLGAFVYVAGGLGPEPASINNNIPLTSTEMNLR
jgi:hypothetical protein